MIDAGRTGSHTIQLNRIPCHLLLRGQVRLMQERCIKTQSSFIVSASRIILGTKDAIVDPALCRVRYRSMRVIDIRKSPRVQEGAKDFAPGQPWQLIIGVGLIVVAWPLAWFGPLAVSAFSFFPLWLGYILTVDGFTLRRTGTSLIARDGRRFLLLFVFSIPLWWLFEFANQYLQNWTYLQADRYTPFTYFALASIAFSTVMPAVFVTAEMYRGVGPLSSSRHWIRFVPTRKRLIAISVLGMVMFVASLIFPGVAFPLVWVGIFLLLDPINVLIGGKSLLSQVAEGRWDTILVLFAAAITCGFFWEMWNFWSLPKWVYHVPYVGHPKIFEMPVLGFGGYFPFALEIFAFYNLVHTLVFRRRDTYLRLDEAA